MDLFHIYLRRDVITWRLLIVICYYFVWGVRDVMIWRLYS